jgi:N-sulfoglucosamine sulfohydrolase
MRQALRQRQLELYDSGLLPETMRAHRAREHGITIYEMVRNPKLYPLERYLDAADTALQRNPNHLRTFVKGLSDADSGIRYWAVVGLHLLEDKAAPAVGAIEKALQDESDEVKIMAAWTLVRLGRKETGLACLRSLLHDGTPVERELLNVLDWMEEDAVPLVREYLAAHPKKATNILAKIAQDHGIDMPK